MVSLTDNEGTDVRSALKDEEQNYSMSRILLIVWTTLIIGEVIINFHEMATSNPLLAFLSGIYLVLVGWAAGPRMAKYIFPAIGQIVNSIGQAKLRDPGISSDVSEIVQSSQSSSSKKTLIKG